MITVAEINSFEKVNAMRLVWRDLWQQTRDASFIQSFDWFENYYQSFGFGKKLRLFLVSSLAKPIGIVPFVVNTKGTRLGKVRELSFPRGRWGTVYGPIGPHPAATLAAAVRHLRDTSRDWDVVDLCSLDSGGTGHGRMPNAFRSAGLKTYSGCSGSIGVVEMDCGWIEYWASRDRSHRDLYRRAHERLSRFGEISYRRYRPEGGNMRNSDPRWDLFGVFQRMASRSLFAESKYPRFVPGSAESRFLSKVHAAASKLGAVDVNLLCIENRPVACAYSYYAGGRVEGVRLVQASDVTSDAGVVLMHEMLRDGFRRRDVSFAFPRLDTSSAVDWVTSLRDCGRYTHFASTRPKAQILRLNHCIKNWFGEVDAPAELPPRAAIAREVPGSGLSVVS